MARAIGLGAVTAWLAEAGAGVLGALTVLVTTFALVKIGTWRWGDWDRRERRAMLPEVPTLPDRSMVAGQSIAILGGLAGYVLASFGMGVAAGDRHRGRVALGRDRLVHGRLPGDGRSRPRRAEGAAPAPGWVQTETGSRYSPKTSRRTAHCSPSVAYAAAHRMKWGMRFVSLVPGRRAASRRPASAASTTAASRSRRVRSSRAMWASNDPGGTDSTGTVSLGLVDVRVHADDPPLTRVELALVAVRGVGDLALRITLGDRRDHPAPPVDLVDVAPDLRLHLGRQGLDEPATRRAGRPWPRRRSPRR